MFHSLAFPLTHDLEELLELAEQGGIEFPSRLQEVGSLTPYAVETRYPGDWQEISNEEVEEAIDLADQMVDWIFIQLGLVRGEVEENSGRKRNPPKD